MCAPWLWEAVSSGGLAFRINITTPNTVGKKKNVLGIRFVVFICLNR